jgi:hypothetical protein
MWPRLSPDEFLAGIILEMTQNTAVSPMILQGVHFFTRLQPNREIWPKTEYSPFGWWREEE